MSRRRRRPQPSPTGDVRGIIRDELAKALAVPAGAHVTNVSQSYLSSLARNGRIPSVPSATLPRDSMIGAVPFGPGQPLYPAPLDPLMGSGRSAPRRYEYPVSWNLNTTDRHVPFSVLRDVASQVSIIRDCVEVRKSAIIGLGWSFTIDPTRVSRIAESSGQSRYQVTTELSRQYADVITELQDWWSRPDKINDWTFSEWLTALLEDQLVLDAVAIYPHLALGGDLHSLELIDSSTVKPLLDHRGATPQPPQPAFQQILYGFPRGEYTASPPGEVHAEFTSAVYNQPQLVGAPATSTDTLIYKVRYRRSDSPYGRSCTERAIVDADLWLKRLDWLRSEYSAGVTPDLLIKVDDPIDPTQLRQWEQVFNDDLAGRNMQRHGARLLPRGFDPVFSPGLDSKYSPDFDLHLIRLLCSNFDVLPSTLGFVPLSGLGGKGHQEGEHESERDRATKPTAAWLTDLINEISRVWLGMPAELTFQFEGLEDEDEERTQQVLSGYVATGVKTVNEARDHLGLPRYELPRADEPFLSTQSGPVFLNSDLEPPARPTSPPAEASGDESEPEPADDAGDNGDDTAEERRSEVKAFVTFAKKRAKTGSWRDFEFLCHPTEVGEAANRLAAAGDLDAVKALFEMAGDRR